MNNRILAMLLAIIMIVSIVPVNAFATENAGCTHTHNTACGYGEPCSCASSIEHSMNYMNGDCDANKFASTGVCYYAQFNGACVDENSDIKCDACGKLMAHEHVDTAGGGNGICDIAGCKEHVHKVQPVEAVEPTCTTNGNLAYFKCETEGCGVMFRDAEGKVVGSESDFILTHDTENGHKLTLVDAVPNTCKEIGNVAYYVCEYCDGYFDANTKAAIANKSHVNYGSLAEHTWKAGYFYTDETGHYQVCSVCDAHSNINVHNTFTYKDGKKICGHCGYAFDHICVDANGNCSCDQVGCDAEMEHDWEWVSGTANHYQKCKNTKCVFNAKTDTKPHEDGNNDCVCDACGGNMQHTLTAVEAKAATCAEDGNIAHQKCTNCNATFDADGKPVDPVTTLDHWVIWAIDETTGGHVKVCKRSACKKVLSEPEEHEVAAFTTQYETNHQGVCSICELVVTADHFDSADDNDCSCDDCGKFLGHSLTTVAKVTPNCGVDGNVEHQLCAKCGKTFTMDGNVLEDVTIKARKHWEIWEYDVENKTHRKICKYSNCRTVIVEPTDHDYVYINQGDGTHTATCPTCKYGEVQWHVDEDKNCHCDLCEVYLGHKMKTVTRVEAKCGINGTKGHKVCETCGRLEDLNGKEITAEDIVIPALQHKWWPKGKDLSGTLHTEQCEYCKIIRFLSHFDATGDCMCDYEGCTDAAHEHTVVHVPAKAATCVEEGNQEYWYFAECDKKFSDEACTQPLTQLVIYGTTAHTWGDWNGADDGENHERACTVVGCDAKETAEHDFSDESPYCGVCGDPEGLEYQEEVPATCTQDGVKAHYKSTITQRRYWTTNVDSYISDVNELVILKGHDLTPWMPGSSGEHLKACKRCDYVEEGTCASADGNCLCDLCNYPLSGDHRYTNVKSIAPTCEKPGQLSAVYCAKCNKYYDAETAAPLSTIVVPALGHDWEAEWYNDSREGAHSKDCLRCHEKISVAHDISVESVNKGNLHEGGCSICDYVEYGVHFDKDGDSECDECGYDSNKVVSGSSMNNHRETITIKGDKDDTVEEKQSNWWNSFVGKLNPSYVGESQSSSAPSASVGSSGANGSAPAVNQTPSIETTTGSSAVDVVINFLMNLLNTLLGR